MFVFFFQLPSNTVELLLMGNELYKLANNSFLSAPFLTKLDLSNNAISTIELGALNGLSSLEFLDLSGNQLDGTSRHLVFIPLVSWLAYCLMPALRIYR